jgi:hypothetical protein
MLKNQTTHTQSKTIKNDNLIKKPHSKNKALSGEKLQAEYRNCPFSFLEYSGHIPTL